MHSNVLIFEVHQIISSTLNSLFVHFKKLWSQKVYTWTISVWQSGWSWRTWWSRRTDGTGSAIAWNARWARHTRTARWSKHRLSFGSLNDMKKEFTDYILSITSRSLKDDDSPPVRTSQVCLVVLGTLPPPFLPSPPCCPGHPLSPVGTHTGKIQLQNIKSAWIKVKGSGETYPASCREKRTFKREKNPDQFKEN